MTAVGINGRFLTRKVTGVDRYARELVRAMDPLVSAGQFIIVVPEDSQIIEPTAYSNIGIQSYGSKRGHAWEQFDYHDFLESHSLVGLNLCNTAPLRAPGVVCIHDMAVRDRKENYSRKFRTWYRILFSCISKRSSLILTVSEYSKRRIEHYYPSAQGKIAVVPNSWQHVLRINGDPSSLDKYHLEKGSYYFAMSSLSPNKNLRWIVDTARKNPSSIFAVAGGINQNVFAQQGIPEAANVRYLGYVTDDEAKTLIQGSSGFLFPTLYEGFGIPPLEALAYGARVAVSDIEIMHEVCGDSVRYFDPNSPSEDIDKLFAGKIESPESVLSKYSWDNSAKLLLNCLSNNSIL